MEKKRNGYSLTRTWFDFAGEHPELLTPTHTAMYLYLVDLNNSLGWKDRFFAPAKQTMHFISLKSYNTYSKVFKDLVLFGFIRIIKESKNQYQSNLITLSKFDITQNKARDKHLTKQTEITNEDKGSIVKQENNKTNKQVNIENIESRKLKFQISLQKFKNVYENEILESFFKYWAEPNKSNTQFRMEEQNNWETSTRSERWVKGEKNKNFQKKAKSRTEVILSVVDELTKK